MSFLTSLEATMLDVTCWTSIRIYTVHSMFFFAFLCFSVKYLQPFGPHRLILLGRVWPLLPLRGN